MNKEDIIRMAQEAGMVPGRPAVLAHLRDFAALVAAAEREACAKLCDVLAKATHPNEEQIGPGSCAAAIRAREKDFVNTVKGIRAQ